MRKFLIFLFLLMATSVFAQTTINIPADYSTIQAGLNAAQEGDTVLVATGTYYENIIWPAINGIKLISEEGSLNCIIDGQNKGTVIYVYASELIDSTTLISGFRIQNGGEVNNGGGLYLFNASPTIESCVIARNLMGGGVYMYSGCNPLLNNIEISDNTGNGLYCFAYCNPRIIESEITNNSGVGIILVDHCSPRLQNVIISNNNRQGIYLTYQCHPQLQNVEVNSNLWIGIDVIDDCSFSGDNCLISDNFPNGIAGANFTLKNSKILNNYGGQGAGIYSAAVGSSFTLDNVIISGNHTTYKGGGIYLYNKNNPTLKNVLFYNNVANKGGAIYLDGNGLGYVSEPDISNCTFVENFAVESGGGIFSNYGKPKIDSSVFLKNRYAVFNNTNAILIEATNNYWGDSNGPFHLSQNPNGIGDSTNQYINITPWLTEPSLEAPPIPVQDLVVTSTTDNEINLEWGKSIIGDLAGYKIHYDTDSTDWEFANSIDVGFDTNYTMSNLQIGQTYYVSVTCYDTDGNESWYSQTVSANTTPAPIISINVNEVDFGSITIEKETTFDIEITNNGTDVLTIFNSQTATDEFYTNQIDELNINPNETVQLPVYFKPLEIGEFQDELTINSNANNEPQIIIHLSGSGVLPEAPTILSVTDVPDDQGSSVRIEFKKSRYDQNGDLSNSIASYSVWRLNTNSEWDAIGMFNADRSEKYNFVSSTLGDSTVQGIIWSVFKISAHAVNPDDFYYSDSDSGYSIDNIAPNVPQGLNAEGFGDRVEIAWNNNKEKDFQYFAIYRSTDSDFDPDTMKTYTFTTIDSSYIDTDVNYGVKYYYKISAFDYAGNQSEYTYAVSALVTDIDKENLLPKEYVLHQNYPNPFNPSTMIKYGIPEQSNVKIEIFNMLGQSVGVLVNSDKSAGYYETTWNATNLPSGIYLISITANGLSSKKNFTQVKKTLLLK